MIDYYLIFPFRCTNLNVPSPTPFLISMRAKSNSDRVYGPAFTVQADDDYNAVTRSDLPSASPLELAKNNLVLNRHFI